MGSDSPKKGTTLGGSPDLGYVVSQGGYNPFVTRLILLRGVTNHGYKQFTKLDDPPSKLVMEEMPRWMLFQKRRVFVQASKQGDIYIYIYNLYNPENQEGYPK